MCILNALECTYILDPCLIINQVSRIETLHFCVIKCAKDTNTLFYVAEVVSNNSENNSLTVQWWSPNAIAKQRGGKHHNIAFEACTTKTGKEGLPSGASNHTSIQSNRTLFTLNSRNWHGVGGCLQKCSANWEDYHWLVKTINYFVLKHTCNY